MRQLDKITTCKLIEHQAKGWALFRAHNMISIRTMQ